MIGSSNLSSAQAAQSLEHGNPQRPNILLILADDLAWSDLSYLGSEISTPNLDALAQDGLSMTQFYNSARCSPSRASLLTGLHPHQAGVGNIGPPLNNRCVTLPEVLGPAGYHTSMVGKWHLTERSTPVDRGFQEFYGMLGGFDNYFKEDPGYTRLPAGRAKREYKPGEFYATDVFGDYSIDFIDQAQRTNKPWFQYLAFTAPHFPLMAPDAVIDKYEKAYQKGWDVIRAERLARQKKLGVVPQELTLPPRSMVPRNRINERTGWADKQNPAWDSLPADRRADLARRMAVYGAMVEIMDRNIGRVVNHLKATGQFENTVIFFLSDNGACAEWDPYGFDQLDSPKNILHTGAELEKIGASDSYISYGSGWANASNTPWRLYKHYGHEGGIATPFIARWPAGMKRQGERDARLGYITDLMPTLLDLTGAKYPEEFNGHNILPHEGVSLLPALRGEPAEPRTIFMEHEGNRAVRDDKWKLVALHDKPWELYDIAADRTEMHDLAAQHPEIVQKMSAAWEAWAQRCMVKPRKAASPQTPQIVNKALTITCEVTPQSRDGVILAQGGDQRGYALHLQDGKPIFSVRQNGKLYTAAAPDAPEGKFSLEAHLEKNGAMTLAVNGNIVARGKAPGVFTVQPKDELSIGEDVLSAVGDYTAPHPLQGKVENVKVTTK
ncbi:MAG: sulfatase-like hydrolase/transferase, partial [Armatimonadota bacterium]|nr:sulfatase-like hydrolase/transferase [Armatimonadota bacterium]